MDFYLIPHPRMSNNGTIKMINKDKGFGFIRRENEADLFFHFSECGNSEEERRENFHALVIGTTVRFDIAEGRKGLEGHTVRNIDDR